MNHDTLSDVLRFVRLRGAVFYDNYFGHQWAAEAPGVRQIAEAVMPGAEHVMEYHVIMRGSCWAAIVGEPPVRLETGDIVLFPHGDPHVMSSAPGMRPPPVDIEWVRQTSSLPKPILLSDDLAGTPSSNRQHAPNNLVCGFLGCDLRPFNPLLANLPRILHLPAKQEDNWIAPVLMQAINASHEGRPGCEALLERLSEMMFVDAISRYVDNLPDESSGWLAGLRNRHIGRALALLHADPARAWTIEELANEVALSRSAFYDRFLALIGQPPMQYLTHWRMQLGARLLRETQSPVAAIALDVGYESEAAFARAFKRIAGKPPATWRRELRSMGAEQPAYP
jgi:AraC-like DNA-binding protein